MSMLNAITILISGIAIGLGIAQIIYTGRMR